MPVGGQIFDQHVEANAAAEMAINAAGVNETGFKRSACSVAARDALFRRGPTVSGAIGEAQKRRDGFSDRVRPDSVGSIVAHEAIVVELSRAFFRAVEPEAKRNNASRVATGHPARMERKFKSRRTRRCALSA